MNQANQTESLRELFLQACPEDSEGGKSLLRLAEEIGYSRRTIYFMIQNNQVSKRAVERIVEKCAPRVSHADFMPFLFK